MKQALVMLTVVALLGPPSYAFAQAGPCDDKGGLAKRLCQANQLLQKLDTTQTGPEPETASPQSLGVIPTVLKYQGVMPTIGATGTTGAVRFQSLIIQWKVIDDGSQLRLAPPPQSAEIRRESLGCGPPRACVARPDLRVVNVQTYGHSLASEVPFTVDVTVENHGRQPTATAEGLICFNGLNGRRCGDGGGASFIIPALGGGERATIRRTVSGTAPQYTETADITVMLDADESVDDVNRANNSFVAKGIPIEKPDLSVLSRTPPPTSTASTAVQPVDMVRVQNPSRSVATGEMPLIAALAYQNGDCRTRLGKEAFTLPSIPPKAVVELRVIYPQVFATCTGNGAENGWQYALSGDSKNHLGPMENFNIYWMPR